MSGTILRAAILALSTAGLLLVGPLTRSAPALITGGSGNAPVAERPWPAGALSVANLETRIAWWEGPPFGGGEWHFEYRGDAEAFNEALRLFAKIDAPQRRLAVYDGTAQSFWASSDRDPQVKAEMDWSFLVWERDRFNFLFNNPELTIASRSENFGRPEPPLQMDVYTGGQIDWSKVKVPEGIEVDDQRLAAHGHQLSDGVVVDVMASDMATGGVLLNAELLVQRIEPQQTGGYKYSEVTRAVANTEGRIVLSNLPYEWLQLVLQAPGYAPRMVGYLQDNQPRWHQYAISLTAGQTVSGRVIDRDGQPVANATVRIDDVIGPNRQGYPTGRELSATTNAQGLFQIEQVPTGSGRCLAFADDYLFRGLAQSQALTQDPIEIVVEKAGRLKVTVDFGNRMPSEPYLVEVHPEEGDVVGSWGGSAQLGADGTFLFTHVPSGRYTLSARPNPGAESERTASVVAEVKPGETAKVTLQAN